MPLDSENRTLRVNLLAPTSDQQSVEKAKAVNAYAYFHVSQNSAGNAAALPAS